MKPLLYILAGLSFILISWQPKYTSFQILPESKIALHGSSNISQFTCNCSQYFKTAVYQLDEASDQCYLKFHQTNLYVNTRSLNCGNTRMNNDMYSALKAKEYPTIQIQLHNVNIPTYSNKEWENIQAKATIKIAGQSKTTVLFVKMKKLADNKVRLLSSKSLMMTDFSITPPSAMLGMIQVRDNIDIEFDLIVAYH